MSLFMIAYDHESKLTVAHDRNPSGQNIKFSLFWPEMFLYVIVNSVIQSLLPIIFL